MLTVTAGCRTPCRQSLTNETFAPVVSQLRLLGRVLHLTPQEFGLSCDAFQSEVTACLAQLFDQVQNVGDCLASLVKTDDVLTQSGDDPVNTPVTDHDGTPERRRLTSLNRRSS